MSEMQASHECVDDELLKVLRCPLSHKPLEQHEGWLFSTDPTTRRRYPIRDGIPIMLVDASEEMSDEEFRRVTAPRATHG